MLYALPLALYYELLRRSEVNFPAMIIACMFSFSAYLALADRKSDRLTIQFSLAIAAYLTATLQVVFNQGDFRAIPLALFFSAFRLDSAITFLLPVATAILGASHFVNHRAVTPFRIVALSLIVSLLTITNTRWAMGFWQHRLIFLLPCFCMFLAIAGFTRMTRQSAPSTANSEQTVA